MRIAAPVHLTEKDRDWLTKTIKSALTPQRLSERCFVVLLAASGKRNDQIAQKLKITRQKVARWRGRFLQLGRVGIESDEPGRGRKHTYTPEIRRLIVRMTTQETPKAATHWSRQTMAKELGVSPSTIGRVWREHGLKPHLARTFKVSKDPRFAEKLEDVVGLYLNAPEHAIVLCCDEKSQVQALDRTQPGLPPKERPRRHDDARLCAPWHDHPFCRPQRGGRKNHWPMPESTPASRMAPVSEIDRTANAGGPRSAFDSG